jgi:hypothetical protein
MRYSLPLALLSLLAACSPGDGLDDSRDDAGAAGSRPPAVAADAGPGAARGPAGGPVSGAEPGDGAIADSRPDALPPAPDTGRAEAPPSKCEDGFPCRDAEHGAVDGTCRRAPGATTATCCFGCWDGARCLTGTYDQGRCGRGGALCASCAAGTACVPSPIAGAGGVCR